MLSESCGQQTGYDSCLMRAPRLHHVLTADDEGGTVRKFLYGSICGLALATAFSAVSAQLIGYTDCLLGWDVGEDGESNCFDPNMRPQTYEIECD